MSVSAGHQFLRQTLANLPTCRAAGTAAGGRAGPGGRRRGSPSASQPLLVRSVPHPAPPPTVCDRFQRLCSEQSRPNERFCENAARWREHGNSAETRIFIIPTPKINNNTARAIGLSFRLSSPTIPKGRQAASQAKHIAQSTRNAAAETSASAASLSHSLTSPSTSAHPADAPIRSSTTNMTQFLCSSDAAAGVTGSALDSNT